MIVANFLMVALIMGWIAYIYYHNQEDPKNDEF